MVATLVPPRSHDSAVSSFLTRSRNASERFSCPRRTTSASNSSSKSLSMATPNLTSFVMQRRVRQGVGRVKPLAPQPRWRFTERCPSTTENSSPRWLGVRRHQGDRQATTGDGRPTRIGLSSRTRRPSVPHASPSQAQKHRALAVGDALQAAGRADGRPHRERPGTR